MVLTNGGPAGGRHFSSLLEEADSHDVELLPPGSARSCQPGAPAAFYALVYGPSRSTSFPG